MSTFVSREEAYLATAQRLGRERDESRAEVERLRQTIHRIYADRRESDKVLAYCLHACPELTETATTSRTHGESS